jgi:hypothetical protein
MVVVARGVLGVARNAASGAGVAPLLATRLAGGAEGAGVGAVAVVWGVWVATLASRPYDRETKRRKAERVTTN